MRAATSSTESTSSASSMRRMLAKALISTGLVAFGFFEQQRRAAALDGAVGEFGDLEDRVHLEGDALQSFSFPARE